MTREKAVALFGEGLRTGLNNRGDQGHRAWEAISEMPEDEQHAALGSLLDHLEEGGVVLYRISDDGRG